MKHWTTTVVCLVSMLLHPSAAAAELPITADDVARTSSVCERDRRGLLISTRAWLGDWLGGPFGGESRLTAFGVMGTFYDSLCEVARDDTTLEPTRRAALLHACGGALPRDDAVGIGLHEAILLTYARIYQLPAFEDPETAAGLLELVTQIEALTCDASSVPMCGVLTCEGPSNRHCQRPQVRENSFVSCVLDHPADG